ncbi:hypothetical protein AGLY_005083 [Aphis glycines]|uniref:Uncharacterized protein n=1 Tax=Aphis glycines TaxID=307491 RepID=A0A6G0TVV9_APHGL|nr:hypothetical protein AGLY_005083 [Aphis glycines]
MHYFLYFHTTNVILLLNKNLIILINSKINVILRQTSLNKFSDRRFWYIFTKLLYNINMFNSKNIKKVGKWVPFCCIGRVVGEKGGLCFNGLNTPKFKITYEELCKKFTSILIGPKKFYRHFKKNFSEKLKISVIFEEKFMENLVPNFQNLVIKEKIFMIFQLQNYLQIFAFSTDFFLNYNHKKKSIWSKTGFA